MAKNIVIYSDGTGQDGGVRPEQRVSNIYKMYRASRVSFDTAIDPAEQVTFYDPGLGTDLGSTALTTPVRNFQRLLSSIDGRGITNNIVDCYTFILNHYEPGDRIFLFGFSRGAYTVRSVADLLRLCGVPTKCPDGDVPKFRAATRNIAEEATFTVLEHGAGHPRKDYEDEREELARRFRVKYGSEHPSGEAERSNTAPYFIGVFDTVAALGASGLRRRLIQIFVYGLLAVAVIIPATIVGILSFIVAARPFWFSFLLTETLLFICMASYLAFKQRSAIRKTIRDFPKPGDKSSHLARWEGKNFNRLLSRFVVYARSANAIDETRVDFARVPWGPTVKGVAETAGIPTFKQYFFAGNHSDVGGSYAEVESRLSDIALEWMIGEAVEVPNGLKTGPVFINNIQLPGTGSHGTALYLFPNDSAVQHSEILGMRDLLNGLPWPLSRILKNKNYAQKDRDLPKDATVHPTVEKRFARAEGLPSRCDEEGSGFQTLLSDRNCIHRSKCYS